MKNEKTIIEMLAMQVKTRINRCVEEADKYTKDMNEDYEHFFCWYSEDMFKVQRRLKIYRELQKVLNTEGLNNALECMRHAVEHFTDDLIHGSLQSRNTEAPFRAAHLLEIEVKQRIIQDFQALLYQCEEQGKKIAG